MKLTKLMKRIGTHSGNFHVDEALACYMLKQIPEYKDSEIVRSRNPAELEKCDIVVDVGGVFDPAKNRFDHHQRDFNHTMQSILGLKYTTKLSSAGLIYAHFGKEVIKCILNENSIESRTLDILYNKLYERFVEEIDAVDNGITACDGIPRYAVTTTISARVGNLNPSWNQKDKDNDKFFPQAMELVGSEFRDRLLYLYQSWLPARDAVNEAIQNRFEVHSSGEIMCLSNGGLPWKDHFFELEAELPADSTAVKYVIFEDGRENSWRVQCIPKSQLQGFESRLPLPEAWRGVRDSALDEISGIKGIIEKSQT